MEEAHSFAEMHKLIFNASKSLTTFLSTNRHLFNYQPKISMNEIQLCYVKNAKYLGYTLDQEITSNKHIEGQVIKARKKLNVLKFISGRDWGAEASTLRTTFISLIRPVLEFVIPIYCCASDTNLNKLERVQFCAARIITGLRYSCQNDILLFESNLPSLSKRRLYSLTSPFSYARTLNLPSSDVEPHSLSFTGAGLELDGIYFHDQLLTNVTKSSEIPALVNQLALETINGIPQSSLKIYTDGSRGEKCISGSRVYIPTPSGALEFKIKNPNYCSVFRSELIAIRRGLQCAAQLEYRFQEIWILTDSRASIQHLANWGDIGDQTSLDILSLLRDLSSGHGIHFQWIPSPVGIKGNERADFLARTAAVEGVSPRGNLTFSEISTISKLELNRQIKTPPSHAWYLAKCPGESFRLSSRPLQSTYSRFLSGHTRALRFSNGQKTFPECHWCSSGEASPNHILLCLGFKRDEVLCDPLLFLDFFTVFRIHGDCLALLGSTEISQKKISICCKKTIYLPTS
ncbi:putative RNA-directed DNA polymerase from transposon BS [Trichonephila clavipes]|nr:putative RNA-directed DNA polymerase from transposon BS [Trichonephila clavipes]